MTVEVLKIELEKIISSLTSSGFDSIDPQMAEKLKELTTMAGELNMNEGKRLIENLAGAMQETKEEKSKIESCNVRLMALDFYVKKLSAGTHVEDL